MYGVVVLPLIYLFINILRLLILKSFRTAVIVYALTHLFHRDETSVSCLWNNCFKGKEKRKKNFKNIFKITAVLKDFKIKSRNILINR